MPLTPTHPFLPWLAYVRWPRAFSFWALTFGAMASDLEVLPLWAFTGNLNASRGLMHSLLGVFTLNAIVTILVVRYLVPPASRWFASRDPRTLRFAGQDLRRDPTGLRTVYVSAVLGGLTHLAADLPHHAFNPLLWPWIENPLKLIPIADELWWDLVWWTAFLGGFVAMMAVYWRR